MSNWQIGLVFGEIALIALGLTGLFAINDLISWVRRWRK